MNCKAILLAAGLGSAVSASAIPVNGVVTFGGVALLDNANSALATQASILLPSVIGVAGDFTTTISVGDVPVMTSPLVLGAFPASVWILGGFTFVPSAPLVGGGGPNNTFSIGATGTIDDGPGGYDPTPAIFALATTPTIGGLGGFASITAASGPRVPEAGNPLALLGFGLLAITVVLRPRSS